MQMIRKHISWLLCTVLLGGILLFCVFNTEDDSLLFCVSDESGEKEISVYSGIDGKYYVFLPSYANMNQVMVVLPSNQKITIGERTLSNGMDCGQFELDTDYEFRDNKSQMGTLRFCKSANVATMYIDTSTGTMKHIHADKNAEEKASVVLIRADGTVEHEDMLSTITGRGNTTWSYNKKPYNLKLSSEASLLEMGAATDWVLLANAADGSNLNNKLIYDLANRLGIAGTPRCEYVDVYLNGEYSGLYLLSEKVEVGEQRLEIDTAAGDFLCEFAAARNSKELSYTVTTDRGRSAVIQQPEGIDNTQRARIDSLVKQMERELLSGDDLTKSSIIDLDSWVRKYILDEISANVDSDRASCYFYYTDGLFYAGPIWDYDKGFGNCQQSRNPQAFVANNEKRSATYPLPYYPLLYKNPSFYNRVCEIYKDEFLPLLIDLTENKIAELADYLSASAKMDSLRWKGLTPELQSSALIYTDSNSVLAYLHQKIALLNSAWIDGMDYCTVQFELSDGAEYVNYAVERGGTFSASDIDTQDTVWIDSDTGEVFDFSQPITENLILHIQPSRVEAPSQSQVAGVEMPTVEILAVASILVVVLLTVCLIAVDMHRRKTERRLADDKGRNEIPT